MHDRVWVRQVQVFQPARAVKRNLECAPHAELHAATQRCVKGCTLHDLGHHKVRRLLRHGAKELHHVGVVHLQVHPQLFDNCYASRCLHLM